MKVRSIEDKLKILLEEFYQMNFDLKYNNNRFLSFTKVNVNDYITAFHLLRIVVFEV